MMEKHHLMFMQVIPRMKPQGSASGSCGAAAVAAASTTSIASKPSLSAILENGAAPASNDLEAAVCTAVLGGKPATD